MKSEYSGILNVEDIDALLGAPEHKKIQEQEQEIAVLKKRVSALEKEVEDLKGRLS